VIQRALWPWIGPVHGKLGHEQVGEIIIWVRPEISDQESFSLIEVALPCQSADFLETGRTPGAAPECSSTGAHEGK